MTQTTQHPTEKPMPAPSGRPGTGTRRGKQPLRDHPLLVWLGAALIVAIMHRWVPDATWLLIHLVALGAITHSIFIWSAHFTAALLKTRPDEGARKRADRRLLLLSLGSLAVFVGVPFTQWWLTVIGGLAVGVAVVWHGSELLGDLKRALPGRFRITVRYYIAAACCLPIGGGFGVALAWGFAEDWHARLLVAHTLVNLLGWVGLTVVGTLITFWPTVLRARMDDRSEQLAARALPVLLAGLAVITAGALLGNRLVAVAGLVVYAVGIVSWGRSLVAPVRRRPPREFASASILAAILWFGISVVATALHLLTTSDMALADGYPMLASMWVVGFLLQLLTGALSYLLPSVLGGGPRILKAGAAWFDRYAALRLTVINLGLILWLLPLPDWGRLAVAIVAVAGLASFIPLLVCGLKAALGEKRRMIAGEDAAPVPDRGPVLTGSGMIAGVAAISIALAIGVGTDPAAAGLTAAPTAEQQQGAVAPTGDEVRVSVEAHGMYYEPASIEVNAGDHVIIELTNYDPANPHDLAFGDLRTPRLGGGQTAELDLGVVGESMSGWCTVTGHLQAGMTFEVIVADAPAAPVEDSGGHHDPGNVRFDPQAQLSHVIDPVVPAWMDEPVHEVTLTVTEEPLEVAPGVWQRRWTFNGESVGPTLRGRVGDVFEITLINDGTIGHSIDFHAGALAPDEPMRTIGPGESLVYRFTAERAGIWMYHCGTSSMSAHIGAGMHGAVIIEPAGGLPEVDREYVVVQSEIYMDGDGASPETALEVDAQAAMDNDADFVTFNGVANQYLQEPFEAVVGETVRFWVLVAGPNRATSFHIVGGQFDTLYAEGGYRLRDNVDPFGVEGGGAQALGMEAAEGGFVELVFPEAGHYPVVSHIMGDAERGAMGIVKVTDH